MFCAVTCKTWSGTKVPSWVTSEAPETKAESHDSESNDWRVKTFILGDVRLLKRRAPSLKINTRCVRLRAKDKRTNVNMNRRDG